MIAIPEQTFNFNEARHDYPVDLLIGCETALVLFAAGFAGFNDGSFIRDAGLKATCVDSDPMMLEVMERRYPPDWEFVLADVYEFAAAETRQWDVLSIDPWTNQFTICADMIETWCRLARVAVILGTGKDTILDPPQGWEVTGRVWRTDNAGGVFWSMLERT